MDHYLKYSDSGKKSRKRYKNQKPYGNEGLNILWKSMSYAERQYIKYHGPRHRKEILRAHYVQCRNMFDKALRKAERQYNYQLLSDIDEACEKNPREFWNHIKHIGPRKVSELPQKVYDANNDLVCDIATVLDKWKDDFHSLYNCPDDDPNFEDQAFLESIRIQKNNREMEMNMPDYTSNPELNRPLSFDEVEKAVWKLKCGKSSGIDCIPNEVLKNHGVMLVLYNLYVKCFEYGKIPAIWLKAIISPVPKSSTKDPYVPLNYRGISLLSCVCKVFTSIINKRIVNYTEELDLLVDEQNGFRRKRSCVDHIYALTSLIRNRLSENKSTFACFIDMQKAFDWVNRDMLFHKLLSHNIDGKLYNCIKAVYNHPLSCIKVNGYTTDWFATESGVRQGDSLPLCYLLCT